MRINELMLRDIRAEVDFNDEKIIVKNPKGEVRKRILGYLNEKLMNSKTEDTLTDLELIEMLLKELTNIEITDLDNVQAILLSPCAELNRVIFYLATILQELVFETLSFKNLQMRLQENAILETDTLHSIARSNSMIEEMKQRSYLRVFEENKTNKNYKKHKKNKKKAN